MKSMARQRTIQITIKEYLSPEELSAVDQQLINEAIKASHSAYSPYSNFSVGAALILDSGEIISGNNRENASFPVGICAEQTAIAYAGANYPGSAITAIAICARKGEDFTDHPVSPCGKCRQVMAEEEDRSGRKIRVILYGKSRIYILEGTDMLLPLHFKSSDLRP
jgi:cytidine deaminase